LSIAVVVLFLGVTLWWLAQDRSIPIFDAGLHLSLTLSVFEQLSLGHVGKALTLSVPYPPFSYLVGALGLWVGGVGVASPIVAENLVFVPLLALGCYHVGRLACGRLAGLLAVVVALGSPLIAAQFHVLMTDAPETAMVAVSVWLIMASERFSRIWVSAAAGVAVGLGEVTKEPFVFFVAGVALVTLIRGGWRQWRGLVVFALAALAIALPWYVHYLSRITSLAEGAAAGRHASLYSGVAPPPLSGTNLMWYFWNITNAQLYAPLFAFSIAGAAWMVVRLARRRSISPFAWELVAGAFVGWVGITETFVHDTRYSMPLLVYLAVFAGGAVTRLARRPRLVAAGALGAIAVANTLAISFGVGGPLRLTLPQAKPTIMGTPGVVTLYSNAGFLVGRPQRDGDVLALMQALRRHGVEAVVWINLSSHELSPLFTPDFSSGGLTAFAQIAGLKVLDGTLVESRLTSHDAVLGHGQIDPGAPRPCVRLSDGTGVWVRIGDPSAREAKDYCPFNHPAFYAASRTPLSQLPPAG
jgi:4-amino-4-deoxy-L-arabinose transferase-like glycosyltransferase